MLAAEIDRVDVEVAIEQEDIGAFARFQIAPATFEGLLRSLNGAVHIFDVRGMDLGKNFFAGGIDLIDSFAASSFGKAAINEELRGKMAHSAER